MRRPSLLKLIPLAVIALCANTQAAQSATAVQEDAFTNPLTNYSAEPASVSPQIDGVTEAPVKTVENPLLYQTRASRTLDLIARPDDIWVRIRNGFAVPNIDTPLVAQQQAWFLSHGEYLQRAVARSSRYLYHVVEELEKRGMPTELALLPFIESAYNPMANSPAQASGMWQFIPSTGKNYNLKQNWWQDERRDVIASTDAALSYLENIYQMHGDWHLALASYNWGEGAVKRAIERNQAAGLPTDYLSLKMPDETRNYIPKLQAIKNIIANPELFGINLPKIDNEPYFATIGNVQGMDILTAAKLAEMPIDEFRALNPSFNRPVIPGSANATLLLPTDRIEVFESNLENSERTLVTWQAYTPKKGESLGKVAARFGMSLPYLLQVNSIGPKAHLRSGTTLLVQTKGSPDFSDDRSDALNKMQAPVLSYTTESATRKISRKLASKSAKKTADNRTTPVKSVSARLVSNKKISASSAPVVTRKSTKLATETKKNTARKST